MNYTDSDKRNAHKCFMVRLLASCCQGHIPYDTRGFQVANTKENMNIGIHSDGNEVAQ